MKKEKVIYFLPPPECRLSWAAYGRLGTDSSGEWAALIKPAHQLDTHTHTPLHWSTRKQNNHFEERRNQPQRGGNSVPKVNQCNLSSFCAVVFAGGGGWRWWIGFIVSVGKCSVRYHRITPPPQTCSPQHLHLTRRREGSRLISLGDFDSPSEDCCFF